MSVNQPVDRPALVTKPHWRPWIQAEALFCSTFIRNIECLTNPSRMASVINIGNGSCIDPSLSLKVA